MNKPDCYYNLYITFYDGMTDKHNLIVPKLATSYFTTRGKSFSKYISI